jgi:hypothetical protein
MMVPINMKMTIAGVARPRLFFIPSIISTVVQPCEYENTPVRTNASISKACTPISNATMPVTRISMVPQHTMSDAKNVGRFLIGMIGPRGLVVLVTDKLARSQALTQRL